ncbi:MAG: serine hydrolase [Phycisphaerales bacterium]|nr:serine hydrolase [Phycisphaerales bacterium]
MSKIKLNTVMLIASMISSSPVIGNTPSLDEQLESIRVQYGLPALAGAIVTSNGDCQVSAVGFRKKGSPIEVTEDDQWQLGSCTKAMAATLCAILVDEGTLRWDLTMSEAFPELPMNDVYRDVTLLDLLTHRSGMKRGYPDLLSESGTVQQQRRRLVAKALMEEPVCEPKTKKLYSNIGYVIAGAMTEEAADQSWETLMQKRLFWPLAMSTTGFGVPGRHGEVSQPWGHPNGKPVEPGASADNPLATGPAGRVFSSMQDWAAFAALHLRGSVGDTDLLPQSSFSFMHRPPEGQNYALGWTVVQRIWAQGAALTHGGSNGRWRCVAWLAPKAGFGVLVATNVTGDQVKTALDDAASALIKAHQEAASKSTASIETFRDKENTWDYAVFNVRGWKLLIEENLISDTKLVADIRKTLNDRLKYIEEVIPKKQLAFLKTIPIWVSDEPGYPLRPGENGVIPFHRSPGWLRNHGLNPHMAPGVHFINPHAIMYEHKVFEWAPETMLHELAHAYHNIELGLDQSDIKEAYKAAMNRGLYKKVPSRRDPNKLVQAYAATNQEEYFSEMTEAYFGENDWFPRNRTELLKYDPRGYRAVEKVWGVTNN